MAQTIANAAMEKCKEMGFKVSVAVVDRAGLQTRNVAWRRRGGRKVVLAPDDSNLATARVRPHADNAMVKAVARAFRWREMLESGMHSTIAEIAHAEEINESYVGRVLRLTLLAPDVIESIVNRRQAANTRMATLLRPFPLQWEEQRKLVFADRIDVRPWGAASLLAVKSKPGSFRYPSIDGA